MNKVINQQQPFVICQHCGTNLTPEHVTNAQSIPSSSLTALLLKCPACGNSTKVATTYETWEDAKIDASYKRHLARTLLKDAHGEIEDMVDITYLKEKWSHSPPIREAVMNTCGCDSCVGRLYGEKIEQS